MLERTSESRYLSPLIRRPLLAAGGRPCRRPPKRRASFAMAIANGNHDRLRSSIGERRCCAIAMPTSPIQALRRPTLLAGRRADIARFAVRSQAPSRPDVRRGR